MKILLVLSPSAAAGKTVWTVGFIRAMRQFGLRVGVFKPISEDSAGIEVAGGCISRSAMHLAAAAGVVPCGQINPVLLSPIRPCQIAVRLLGRTVGNVRRHGRDMPLLEELGPALCQHVKETCLSAIEHLARENDLLVVEGAGGASDLTALGAMDLANVVMAERADAIVLVARGSIGGALASVVGTLDLLEPSIRDRVVGFGFNDMRISNDAMQTAARRLADSRHVCYLGAIPWIEWFEGRAKYDPFTAASDSDHLVLAEAVRINMKLDMILQKLELAHVL